MPARHKKSVGKRGRRATKRGASADTEARLLRALRDAGEPLTWSAIRARAGVHGGADAEQLQRSLRDLCRNGELYLDEQGAYHLVASGASVTGVLEAKERQPRRLLLRSDTPARGERSGGAERWPARMVRGAPLREGDRVTARIVAEQAIVTDVIEHSPEPVIGRLVAERGGWYVISEMPGFNGRVYLQQGRRGGAEAGDTVAVRVRGMESYGLRGEVVEIVAGRDELNVASTTLLSAYQVPVEWPEEVLAEAGRLPERVDRRRHRDRVDLTELPLVTIDDESARDFDDAVYCGPGRRGGWRLVVAIADVAHYVRRGSAIDREAAERGNSVYLPDRVVPMQPEALSNELCSLKPREDRLCMVCDMRVSAQGQIRSYEFYEALMHSARRLTYDEVATFLKKGEPALEPEVARSLEAMHGVFEALLAQRQERGALDFDTRELKLVLENGLLERIEPVVRTDAHRLIEEAMIAANICAARFLEKHKREALYRVHEGPTGDKLENLRQALALVGIRLGTDQPAPKALQRILADLAQREDRWLYEMLVLRSMSQALYDPKNIGHFGLALPRYMHFTSPIRRYADLVVHRAIKDVLHGRPQKEQTQRLAEIGAHISYTERRAEEVSRAVEEWLKCEYATRYLGETFGARIIGVTEFGIFAELEEIYVQGLVHISNLGDDFYEFHPGTMSLVGDRTGKRFQLGGRVEVVLAAVDLESRKIDLLLAPDAEAAPARKRRGRKRRRR